MATPFTSPVTATQVGTYFVGQYYQVLQHTPDFVHQFYSNASTMIRMDGNIRETASAMLEIHALIAALNYASIEVKAAHSLESWNSGVIVMVSGSVLLKDLITRRKFVETFFLAPQEKGYYVLNDIFYYVDEDQHQHHFPANYLVQNSLDSKPSLSNLVQQPANYFLGREIHATEFVPPGIVQENGPVDNYGFLENGSQQVHDSESYLEDKPAEIVKSSLQHAVEAVKDHLPTSVDEPVVEPQKHTYASILRVAKGPSTESSTPQASVNRNRPPSETTNQTTVPSDAIERSGMDTVLDNSAAVEEDEIRSVYVKNISPTMTESEIEEEFKKFGNIPVDGVVIRSRKDIGVCYAFVEFTDMTGVHNAVQAGSALVAGRQVFIEERRANSHIPSRVGTGGRGRGRGGYHSEAARGRFSSRSFGRGNDHDGGDRDYNTPRGNGYYIGRVSDKGSQVINHIHQRNSF